MRIASYNINGIVRRLDNLLVWLAATRPDVVCLQEIKCTDAAFPYDALESSGYHSLVRGQGPHHGVAIVARGKIPIETRRALPGDDRDREARYIEAAWNGVLIGCLYLPNGNPQPGPKFAYKMAWFERLIAYAAELHEAKVPALMVGDYNVVPTDADIYSATAWRDNALLQPEPRAAFARLQSAGWVDALRQLAPTDPFYSFWSYERNAWRRNAGMRLDHILIDASIAARLTGGGVDRDVRGAENASDHAPVWVDIR